MGKQLKTCCNPQGFDPSSETDIQNWFLMFQKIWILFNDITL